MTRYQSVCVKGRHHKTKEIDVYIMALPCMHAKL